MTQHHPVAHFHQATIVAPCEHDGLVLKMAQRFTWALKQGALEFTDLVQAGRMGVERAKQTFDPGRGVAFSTYAGWWVKQHMRRLCQNEGSTIRIPVGKQQEMRAKGRVSSYYQRLSIDHHIEDDTLNLLDVLCPTEADHDAPDKAELERRIARAMEQMPERERKVLHVRFFRDGTLEDAGREFGITRERARQIEAVALKRLKCALLGRPYTHAHKRDCKCARCSRVNGAAQ